MTIHLRQALDSDGRLTPNEVAHTAAKATLDELLRMSAALTTLRLGTVDQSAEQPLA